MLGNHVCTVVAAHDRKQINLTISFDGGTTHAIQSIYTVHVITTEKHTAYLVEGDSASDVSHTAKHISKVLFKVRNSARLS